MKTRRKEWIRKSDERVKGYPPTDDISEGASCIMYFLFAFMEQKFPDIDCFPYTDIISHVIKY